MRGRTLRLRSTGPRNQNCDAQQNYQRAENSHTVSSFRPNYTSNPLLTIGKADQQPGGKLLAGPLTHWMGESRNAGPRIMQNLLTPQANACNKKMIPVPFSEQSLWKTYRSPVKPHYPADASDSQLHLALWISSYAVGQTAICLESKTLQGRDDIPESSTADGVTCLGRAWRESFSASGGILRGPDSCPRKRRRNDPPRGLW